MQSSMYTMLAYVRRLKKKREREKEKYFGRIHKKLVTLLTSGENLPVVRHGQKGDFSVYTLCCL